MVSAVRLRDLVAAYLSGAASLESFSNQFALLSSDIEDCGDTEAVQLSYRIESAMADLSFGLISENVLRQSLSIHASDTSVRVSKEYSTAPAFSFRKKDEAGTGPVEVELEYA